MSGENILLAYRGEITTELLDAIYAMMDRQVRGDNSAPEMKKVFHVLVESLQNVFHHQSGREDDHPGFLIQMDGDSYKIITGNLITVEEAEILKKRIDEVNSLPKSELREHYQQALSESEFSGKGGAGLGIIEMARKSGNKLNYEFTPVGDDCSFFSLAVTLP